ncbi:aromatase/cyclase [Streptomyces sp. ODS05-4]|uniref:aromatase/cyclase n=1 Tax=Streptomyces sp. ODS05-4 TaxID=2944939 RepID=UPI0021093B99|nr:aromatase/cyclase [Streptomyces sp. ODS05-4]
MTTTESRSHYAEHDTPFHAPPSRAFELISDVTRWPLMFAPCVHAEVLQREPGADRIRLWALAGDTVRSWTSRRRLDAAAPRVDFEQEDSRPPLASMGGHWRVDGGTKLVLAHHWALTDPTPETERWATEALDRNSDAETAAVRSWAEYGDDFDDLVFGFGETVHIAAPAPAVYDFLYRADRWPRLLPHVTALDLRTCAASELTAGAEVQTMTMETTGKDGSAHSTRSIRLCFDGERIVYKQTAVPRPLRAHSGEWRLRPADGGVEVVARHEVALDPAAVEEVFGAGTTLRQARERTTELLRANSLATLRLAGEHLLSAGV